MPRADTKVITPPAVAPVADPVPIPSAGSLSSMSIADLGRQIAVLDREQNRLNDEGDGIFSEDYGEALGDIYSRQIAQEPETIADTVALLLAIASDFHEAVDNGEYRASLIAAWTALGRVTKVLAGLAKVDCADLGADYYANGVNGLAKNLAAGWWTDRVFAAGGVLLFGEHGDVDVFAPKRATKQSRAVRALLAEMTQLDRAALQHEVGMLAWHGLGNPGLYQNTIPGHRWAITATCVAGEVVTTRIPGGRA